ncbi:DUF4190 domain-containing protein [Leucobacter sp. OH1287]|uniref:DUF4190 domain-containing protein n=1 Tax=Leucobacter sp. OH1287 TaxID=2491049 RepID=UPI000F5FDD94|nr:DUF4190 domain-containing protein [Leucobacter sp. OH1287]RRD60127.1 DUF4190 domain-containing protein [Leucobacter sp. OH1287]
MTQQQDGFNNQADGVPAYQPPVMPQHPQQPAAPQKTNTMAIVGLIAAFVFAPVGAILSFVALSQIKKTGEGGRGLALTGAILGSIFTVFGIIYIIVAMTLIQAAINSDLETKMGDTSTSMEKESDEGGSSSGGVGTSRDNPVEIGTPLKTEDWTVVVNSVNLDATEAVAAAEEYNDPAPDGQVYILVNMTVTYTGKDSAGQTPSLSVEYINKQGNTFGQYDGGSFAVPPEKLDTFETLYEGASLTGNILLTVPKDGVADGVLGVTPEFFADKVFVALQ